MAKKKAPVKPKLSPALLAKLNKKGLVNVKATEEVVHRDSERSHGSTSDRQIIPIGDGQANPKGKIGGKVQRPPVKRSGQAGSKQSAPVPAKVSSGTGTPKLSEVLRKQREAAAHSLGEISTKKNLAPHGIVRARAGTGKTFTSVLSIAHAYRKEVWPAVKARLGFDPKPSPQQAEVWDFIAREKPRTVRYVAFNRSIVKEFSNQYSWLVESLARIDVQLEFSTLHSMAYGLCSRNFKLKWGSTNKYKSRNILEKLVFKKDLNEIWKEKVTQIQATEQIVGYVKINLAYDPVQWEGGQLYVEWDDFSRLIAHYDVEMGGFDKEIYELVNQVLSHSTDTAMLAEEGLPIMDFNDQILFPHIFNLKPYSRFDLGLVDEGQDLNPCQQELVFRFMDRVVLVGDEEQSIYGFAGADIDSIPKMERRMEADRRGVEGMHLTVTRRCGKKIVEEAQSLVPDFEAHESNCEGEVRWMMSEEAKEAMADRDLVLCRLNAPLVATAFRFIRESRRCHIKGRDLGQQLKTTIRNSKAKDPGEFVVWLDKFEEEETARMKKRKNVDPDIIIALQDRCACLRMFAEGSLVMKEMYDKIDTVFQLKYEEGCEPNEGICLSSIHRAKGLEAKRVYILKPEKLPHPMAKTAWAKKQESNLKYVAITRAIEELIWVRSDPRED